MIAAIAASLIGTLAGVALLLSMALTPGLLEASSMSITLSRWVWDDVFASLS